MNNKETPPKLNSLLIICDNCWKTTVEHRYPSNTPYNLAVKQSTETLRNEGRLVHPDKNHYKCRNCFGKTYKRLFNIPLLFTVLFFLLEFTTLPLPNRITEYPTNSVEKPTVKRW